MYVDSSVIIQIFDIGSSNRKHVKLFNQNALSFSYYFHIILLNV